jgi:uncharacterized protein (DUF1499 family)
MTRFAPAPRSPNCVSSRAAPDDREHHIAPLRGVSLDAVRMAMATFPRVALVEEGQGYLHFVVTTLLLRFKDDVEFEAEGDVVHVRSASRTGYGDIGVNRARVEALRKALA